MAMPDFVRRRPILAVVASVLVFALVTFPVWLAQVWSLVSDQTFARYMTERQWGWLVVGPLYGWFSATLAAVMVGVLTFVALQLQTSKREAAAEQASVNSVDLVQEARRRKVREEVGRHLRDLFNGTARHAIGMLYSEADAAVRLLRSAHADLLRRVTANLLIEARIRLEETIQPMLNSQACSTEEQLVQHLQAWGVVFQGYQSIVRYTHDVFVALNVPLDQRVTYWEWRDQDAKFIAAMRDIEHMEGAAHIRSALSQAGWGDAYRPARGAQAVQASKVPLP